MGAQGSKEDEVFLDALTGQADAVESTPGGTKLPPKNKLYQRIPGTAEGGDASAGVEGTWKLVATGVTWRFAQLKEEPKEDSDGDKFEDADDGEHVGDWYFVLVGWAKVFVSRTGLRINDDMKRVDFYFPEKGSLALKMGSAAEFVQFGELFRKYVWENTYKTEYSEKNVQKVLGDFAKGWEEGEDGDEVMWDAGESFDEEQKKKEAQSALDTPGKDYDEALQAKRGPLGLAMGALENSFLLHESGIDVFRNEQNHVQSRGTTISLKGNTTHTPRKGLLIRGETGMLLMSPSQTDSKHSSGLRQVDLEQEKVVAEWKFAKDGTAISMCDVTGDSKGAQLDPDRFTFLGLDDNRLCRWDMRDKNGMVQQLASTMNSPALTWDEGHQFSRGTNFTCFATTGEGCIAVGSRDGKVRLYSTTSMRQAKTSFPGFGVPITHIDVSFDGKWIVATTDKFLFVLNTMWKDAKGAEKSAFTNRAGGNVAAPRLLTLLPHHVAVAGKDYKFEKACFSWVTEAGKNERHVVATVQNYSVIWNLRTVRNPSHHCYQGVGVKSCSCYRVRELDESVVDSKFMHEKFVSSSVRDAPLVVATPHKISSFQFETD